MRTRSAAAAGTSIFFVVAPGVVAGLVPFLLTGWEVEDAYWVGVRVVGFALIVAGAPVLIHAFAQFVREGIGTPAPVAPTEHLVVGGLYRHVRNPMYVAVVAIIVGQGLALGQPAVLAYAAAVAALVGSFVRLYEEPVLRHRFGAPYEAYRRAVPGWVPRLRPWRQETTHGFHPQADPDRRQPG
jgi:protein-S-isoprenylcysteine O-methyltransferase Ste14